MAYERHPITGSQTRLFHLAPALSSEQDLEGHFSETEVDRDDVWEAVSYVWGQAGVGHHHVTVEGISVSITENLDTALRTFRLVDQERTLWIDAICINQNDIEERTQQVALMHQIYGHALRVNIWLGPAFEGVDIAMEFIRKVAEDEKQHLNNKLSPCLTVAGGLTFQSPETLKSLIRLLSLEWWYRCWTLQEIVVPAPTKVLVHCGTATVTGAMVFRFYFNIALHISVCCARKGDLLKELYVEKFDFGSSLGEVLTFAMDAMCSASLWYRTPFKPDYPEHNLDFLSVASQVRSRKRTDPRDIVNGILGMCRSGLKPKLDLGYSYSVETFFRVFASIYIKHSGHLDILSCRLGKPKLLLPSWVPDWTSDIGTVAALYALHVDALRQYNTCLSIPTQVKAITEQTVTLSGHLFDTIDVTLPITRLGTSGDVFSPSRKAIGLDTEDGKQSESREKRYEHTGESLHDAWIATITASLKSHEYFDPTEEIEESMRKLFALLRRMEREGRELPLLRISMPADKASIEEWIAQHTASSAATIMSGWQAAWCALIGQGRRFVTTREGRFGWAPKEAQAGDHVAVLFGGRRPLVLRQTEENEAGGLQNRFTFLGDAYIHGVMDGEIITQYQNAGIAPEDVTLV